MKKVAYVYTSSLEYFNYILVSAYSINRIYQDICSYDIIIFLDVDSNQIDKYQIIANKIAKNIVIHPSTNLTIRRLVNSIEGRWSKVIFNKYGIFEKDFLNMYRYIVFCEADSVFYRKIDSFFKDNYIVGRKYPFRDYVYECFDKIKHDFDEDVLDGLDNLDNYLVCITVLTLPTSFLTEKFTRIFYKVVKLLLEKNIFNDEVAIIISLYLSKVSCQFNKYLTEYYLNYFDEKSCSIQTTGSLKFWNCGLILQFYPEWYDYAKDIDKVCGLSICEHIDKPKNKSVFLREIIYNKVWYRIFSADTFLCSKYFVFIDIDYNKKAIRVRGRSEDYFNIYVTISITSRLHINNINVYGKVFSDFITNNPSIKSFVDSENNINCIFKEVSDFNYFINVISFSLENSLFVPKLE